MGGGGGGVNMPSLPTFGETTSTGSYQNPNPSFGDASIVQSFGNLVRGWENPAVLGAHVARALSAGAAAAAAQAHAAVSVASAVAESAGGAEQGGVVEVVVRMVLLHYLRIRSKSPCHLLHPRWVVVLV